MPEADADCTAAAPQGAERRSYYRVSSQIPIRIRAVDSDEVARLAIEIAAPLEETPAVTDAAVAGALSRLEYKLDLILAHLDPRRPRPLGDEDAQEIAISGSGVKFTVDESLAAEGEVLVEFVLPELPPRHVRVLARPVSAGSDPPKAGPEGAEGPKQQAVAFVFEAISDADRDAIVRFSHEIQRFHLRERCNKRQQT